MTKTKIHVAGRIPPVPFEDTLIQYGTNTVVYMYSEYYAYSDSVLYNLVLAHHVHDVNDDCLREPQN